MTAPTALIGGKYDGARVKLTATPPRILVGAELYVQVIDPDTGEFLGGYAAVAP